MLDRLTRYAPDGAGSDAGAGDGADGSGQTTPQTWDAYVEALSEDAKALYEGHVTGLRNTVTATRTERDTLKARVDALVAGLDGKEPQALKAQLTDLQAELTTANQRAAFLEDATKPEIGCRNPRLAFMVAQAERLFDGRGNPDWAAIKAAAPEIFGTVTPQGNAGSGTGKTPPSGKVSMDDLIRREAGVLTD